MGLTKRKLYKRPRTPARVKGVIGKYAPIACTDASDFEISAALATIGHLANKDIGRGLGYDSLTDKYTVICKNRKTGKAEDFVVSGTDVAALIRTTRVLAGEMMNDKVSQEYVELAMKMRAERG
jgi:hypothetical protein